MSCGKRFFQQPGGIKPAAILKAAILFDGLNKTLGQVVFAFFNLVLKVVHVRNYKVCIQKFCDIFVNIKPVGQSEYCIEQHQAQCHGYNNQYRAFAVSSQVSQGHKVEFCAVGRFFVFSPVLSKRRRTILRIANGLNCRNCSGNLRGLAYTDKNCKKGERGGADKNQRIYCHLNTGVRSITRSVHQERNQRPANKESRQQTDRNTNQRKPKRLPVDLPLCCAQRF